MKRTKSITSLLLAGTLLTGVMMSVALPGASSAYAAETTQPAATGVINVSGDGKLSVKPDIAYVSIGAQTTAATAAKAQASNAQKMNKLTALLKKWSIPQSDIQTVQFYVQPNYNYNDKDGQKVTGYTAYHTLQVKYRDLDKIGQLLDDAAAAGANNVGSVNFDVENPQTYEDQVIAKAMANAAAKAGSIAKAANRTLGELLSVSESGSVMPPIVMQRSEAATSDMSAGGTSVQPGMIELNATLTVQYAMK
ncbi:SIMPL domain-containing protein [Paenibacillus sp. SGZ-1009]|uniref:SIMPL domain-containing protein n=1 Tax=Paenibacillus campi TaxID=3106031 RepID=UPI002AFDE32C|nr:SIMPL domain-containing protein [Paenibacillus sp. SGZ-1009]